jgi:hypothetical protein
MPPCCMSLHTSKVTCFNTASIEHTVRVTTQTLYEAVAQALRTFREHGFM